MGVKTFTLPDLGEGLDEAEIVEWHVSAGDRVVADQPLVSIETDKAVVEVPSPWSGIITSLEAEPGKTLHTGDALAQIDDGARSDTGAIVGTLDPAGSAAKPADSADAAPRRASAETPRTAGAVRALPAVRARARELGVDLAGVTGTGPGGAVTRADVDAAAEGSDRTAAAGARRSMARAMERAHAAVVPATVIDIADITGWYAPDADLLVRIVRALLAGVSAEPALNRWYDPEGTFGVQPEGVALGLAVDTPRGLYVPILSQVDTLTPDALRRAVDDAVGRVRARQPETGDIRWPTISLSNFGAIGGRYAALVVTPPQVAILGAGRAHEAVAWRDGAAARAVHLPLSLTFDHRAVTGGEAARFLAGVVTDLESPEPEPEAR